MPGKTSLFIIFSYYNLCKHSYYNRKMLKSIGFFTKVYLLYFRNRKTKVFVSKCGGRPPSRGAVQKAIFQKVRLVYIF